jgi:transcriptional regulator with XRE-family HTH domain
VAQNDLVEQTEGDGPAGEGAQTRRGSVSKEGRTLDRLAGGLTRQQLPLVGRRIRELRKDHQFTQAELAAKVGIQQSDLCRMETGEYKVSLETLFRILEIFEMNVGEFFHEAPPGQLTRGEFDLVQSYRNLPPAARDEVRHFIKFIERQAKKTRRRR